MVLGMKAEIHAGSENAAHSTIWLLLFLFVVIAFLTQLGKQVSGGSGPGIVAAGTCHGVGRRVHDADSQDAA
jgi:hypothetical protein